MKTFGPLFISLSLLGIIAAAPVSLNLKDGSLIKGEVTAVNQTEAVVSTSVGVVRVPLAEMTPEARALVEPKSSSSGRTSAQRISELESEVAKLRAENADLRRRLAEAAKPVIPAYTPSNPPASQFTPGKATPADPASGMSYSISSTGKRHNSRCRYYGTGRACGATDGIACKICGG